jgi:hypothetical protein
LAAFGGASLAALALVLAPAVAASTQNSPKKKARSSPIAEHRQLHARNGGSASRGRACPARASAEQLPLHAVDGLGAGQEQGGARRRPRPHRHSRRCRPGQPRYVGDAGHAITPTAYNLGLSVGWKRFAISGDVARVQGGPVPGGRESAELGISYQGGRFTGRVSAGAERNDGAPTGITPFESSYSLDVGGSYSIARNIDVTGGVRYKMDRDRLEPLADERRDSQAVYLGTAFRF